MVKGSFVRGLRVAVVAGIFAAGYLCGSLGAPGAGAQVAEPPAKKADKAQNGGGSGLVGDLGGNLNEMQARLDGMQKNIDALKKIKASLGG